MVAICSHLLCSWATTPGLLQAAAGVLYLLVTARHRQDRRPVCTACTARHRHFLCDLVSLELSEPAMSEPRPTVLAMDSSDVVGPGDAALYELLGQIADATREEQKRERIL